MLQPAGREQPVSILLSFYTLLNGVVMSKLQGNACARSQVVPRNCALCAGCHLALTQTITGCLVMLQMYRKCNLSAWKCSLEPSTIPELLLWQALNLLILICNTIRSINCINISLKSSDHFILSYLQLFLYSEGACKRPAAFSLDLIWLLVWTTSL